jgi:hypothetical protein
LLLGKTASILPAFLESTKAEYDGVREVMVKVNTMTAKKLSIITFTLLF